MLHDVHIIKSHLIYFSAASTLLNATTTWLYLDVVATRLNQTTLNYVTFNVSIIDTYMENIPGT